MRVTILQTSDPFTYAPMLEASAATVRAFARRSGCRYESFVGLKRGTLDWHATYNRIPLLQEKLAAGYDGWVLYMDADAFVYDLDFDLAAYLRDKARYGLVIARSGVHPPARWEVNAGVFLINLGHPVGRALVAGWTRAFAAISDSELACATAWGDVPDDQFMLQAMLRDSPEAAAGTFLDDDGRIINSLDAIFIRQVMRAHESDFAHRLQRVQAEAGAVLVHFGIATRPGAVEMSEHAELVEALYHGMLGRRSDEQGLKDHVAVLQRDGVKAGLARVVRLFTESDEFRQRFERRWPGPAR